MNTTFLAIEQANPSAAVESTVRDFITLLKPGVMSLVVFTGLAGMVVAPGTLHPFLQLVTILCVAMGSGAGGALNMWYDRDIDALMVRTITRPVPAGRISADNALAFGSILSVLSVGLLGLVVNWVAAAVLAFAIFYYVAIYTVWLKRRTPQNIVIGGAAGAFPPIIGWLAVTGGSIGLYPFILFLIVFLWTPPHFWALACYRNSDYARAGIPMLPVTAGLAETRRQILLYTYILVPVTLVPVFLNEAGLFYALVALVLGYQFIARARLLSRKADDASARSLFGYSIFYLFALFAALMVDKGVDKYLQLAFTYFS